LPKFEGRQVKPQLSVFSRVGLGTAQFGADYGISNREGRPSEREIAAILERAVMAGVGYLDTAAGYADAEALIGRQLPRGHRLRIVTKLPSIPEQKIEAQHAENLLTALAGSLERLRSAQVYGVLIHQAGDLGKPGWEHLVHALQEARTRGWADRIGVSVYDADDLSLVQNRFKPDIVQIPFNALDRRLAVSGWLTRLKSAGIEIHARSLFLQGLLLMEPSALPDFFAPMSGALTELRAAWAAKRLSALAGCLGYVLGNSHIDVAIVGVNCRSELDEIATALAESRGGDDEFPLPHAVDSDHLDPRRWPKPPH
jgi:aryl-alcohol dehydrogenase-like predicted oxidoreductase